MDMLSGTYKLKDGSVKSPTEYLGATIKEYQLPVSGNETQPTDCWSLSPDVYVKRAVAESERTLGEIDQKLKTKVTTPLSTGYRPELDATPELDDRQANYYQGLIGVLRWIVELGRIDINVGVALLSQFLAAPREGHLEEVFHVFAYLKAYDRSSLVFDPRPFENDPSRFTQPDWSEFYPGAAEAIPPNMPEPRGNEGEVTCYVDADHAGCRVTRRSHTGILLFLQRAPVICDMICTVLHLVQVQILV
jgi:hypothetical protein